MSHLETSANLTIWNESENWSNREKLYGNQRRLRREIKCFFRWKICTSSKKSPPYIPFLISEYLPNTFLWLTKFLRGKKIRKGWPPNRIMHFLVKIYLIRSFSNLISRDIFPKRLSLSNPLIITKVHTNNLARPLKPKKLFSFPFIEKSLLSMIYLMFHLWLVWKINVISTNREKTLDFIETKNFHCIWHLLISQALLTISEVGTPFEPSLRRNISIACTFALFQSHETHEFTSMMKPFFQ